MSRQILIRQWMKCYQIHSKLSQSNCLKADADAQCQIEALYEEINMPIDITHVKGHQDKAALAKEYTTGKNKTIKNTTTTIVLGSMPGYQSRQTSNICEEGNNTECNKSTKGLISR
eukprot:6751883-Ditylum_brightwellii.AAC.1